ncbi:WD40 repeat-like protein [Paramyrothecium foliicola]|nr:WD40 repeat-like protein [Paramyrothecium foliicola]
MAEGEKTSGSPEAARPFASQQRGQGHGPESPISLPICAMGFCEAISGGTLLNKTVESRVLKHATTKGDKIAIKASTPHGMQRSEAAMMQYAAAHGILVPRVRGVYDVATTAPIATVMVSDLVPGRPLAEVWESLTASEQASIKHQLRQQIGLMRRCTVSFAGRVGYRPIRNLWNSTSTSYCGPFDSEEAFNQWCLQRLPTDCISRQAWLQYLQGRQRRTTLDPFCLTHGNLSPQNIIVQGDKVSGIVGWGRSGFFPDYVEYTSALSLNSGFEEWWVLILKEILVPFLYSPADNHRIDVLAVSGLGSHAFGSFMHKDDGTMWLSDKLPDDLSGARVMIYGYNTKLTNSTSFAQLDDLAGSLQTSLSSLIMSQASKKIILVGHSLGGLLIKGAIIRIHASESRPILTEVAGLLLFGVPNDGMSIGSLISMVTDQPNRQLVDSLNNINSHALRTPNRDFLQIQDEFAPKIFCFYETKKSPTAALVAGNYKMVGPLECLVSQTSATSCLPQSASLDHAIAIDRSHSGLVKFAYHDSEYDKVVHVLEQLVNKASSKLRTITDLPLAGTNHKKQRIQPQDIPPGSGATSHVGNEESYGEGELNRCLQDLQWDDPDLDRSRIESTKGGIFKEAIRWILEDTDFQHWRHDSSKRVLWIKGGPGKGKTMLSIGITQLLEEPTPAGKNRLANPSSFFFCQNSDQRINNASAVLKGLMYRLLVDRHELYHYLKEDYDRGGKQLFQGDHQFQALSRVFKKMVCHADFKHVVLVVDGLDECETGLEDLLDLINNTVANVAYRVKWLVTSRNRDDIEQKLALVDLKSRISLELNASHVTTAVHDYIKERVAGIHSLREEPMLRKEVEAKLLQKSDGTFLWVALVLGQIRGILNGEILAFIDKTPSGLMSLYSGMMHQIEESYRPQCHEILIIANLAYRPLSLQELRVLPNLEQLSLGDLERIINKCGSFLTVVGRRVYLAHSSVRDYLTKNSGNGNLLFAELAKAHHSIVIRSLKAMSKVLHRNMLDLEVDAWPDRWTPLPETLEAVKYSCIYWIQHCSSMSSFSNDIQNQITYFLRKRLLYWLEAIGLLQSTGTLDGKLDMDIEWIKLERALRTQNVDPLLTILVLDCWRFSSHSAHFLKHGPLQLYTSALLFASEPSMVQQAFESEIPDWIQARRVDYIWPVFRNSRSEDPARPVTSQQALKFVNTHKVIVTSPNGSITNWDSTKGTLIESDAAINKAALASFISDDCKSIVLKVGDLGYELWDLRRRTMINRLKPTLALLRHSKLRAPCSIDAMAFCPHMELLALVQDNEIIVLRLADEALHIAFDSVSGIEWLAFSPNSRLLASIHRDVRAPETKDLDNEWHFRCTVSVWRLEDGTKAQSFDAWCSSLITVQAPLHQPIVFTPDSTAIAFLNNSCSVQVRKIENEEVINSWDRHSDTIYMDFSPDSKSFVCISTDGLIDVYDLRAQSILKRLQIPDTPFSILEAKSTGISKGSKLLALLYAKKIFVWSLGISFDKRPSEESSPSVTIHYEPINSAGVTSSFLLSNDSRFLAAGFTDGRLFIWDAISMKEIFHIKEEGKVTSLSFSRDSTMLVSGFTTGAVFVLNTETKLTWLSGERFGPICAVAVSQGCKLIGAGSHKGIIQIWDAQAKKSIRTLSATSELTINALCFSDDCSILATGTVTGDVTIWDLAIGCQRSVLLSWPYLQSMGISYDGGQLWSASTDHAICLWDMWSGTLLHTFRTIPCSGNDLLSQRHKHKVILQAEYDATTRCLKSNTGVIQLPPSEFSTD